MEKIRFGKAANPQTIYEKMARQSRKLVATFGKPRSIIAHEERGRNLSTIDQLHTSKDHMALPSLINQRGDSRAKPDSSKRERNSLSTIERLKNHNLQDEPGGRYGT